MTFGCPKAGLNAAAREAAKVPSQGTYQFSYFKIINDSHHAAYEVHFKSNYQGEAGSEVLRRHLLPAGMGSEDHEDVGHEDGKRAGARQGRHAARHLRAHAAAGTRSPPVEAPIPLSCSWPSS